MAAKKVQPEIGKVDGINQILSNDAALGSYISQIQDQLVESFRQQEEDYIVDHDPRPNDGGGSLWGENLTTDAASSWEGIRATVYPTIKTARNTSRGVIKKVTPEPADTRSLGERLQGIK